MTTTRTVRHNQVDLAVHTLRTGITGAVPLLMLHGLGESSPEHAPADTAGWPGDVIALDFTGHGSSTLPVGGGYTAEILLADADIVLAELGRATIVGRGLGAYIAVLLAGARADRVHGVVLADGPGISGGASDPTTQAVVTITGSPASPDPYALFELSRDLRPPDYAATFARLAVQGSPLANPITVTARFRPAWLEAVAREPGVRDAPTLAAALADYC